MQTFKTSNDDLPFFKPETTINALYENFLWKSIFESPDMDFARQKATQ